MITKATHYDVIHNFDDNSIAKYRLFEYTDYTKPNKLIFSTNSKVRFKIQLDLMGLKEKKEMKDEEDVTYYH